MKKHASISVFVPHIGCPCRCIFCDQREISGATSAPTPEYVRELCERHLGEYAREISEIAFFGGSFTAIARGYMLSLLKAAKEYIDRSLCKGIRISTRPDAIDSEVLDILGEYGVTTIELGAQSMDDEVLKKNERGHTAADTINAARLIKQNGFALGLQMMTGMYGSTEQADLQTAERLIELSPDCVRIYPTLVLRNTRLERLYENGEYLPQTLEQAVETAARLLIMFDGASIPVIRTGLHDDESLKQSIMAGPFHSAFGELCRSRVYRKLIEPKLNGEKQTVCVAKGALSQAIGQGRANAEYFKQRGAALSFREDEALRGFEIKIIQEQQGASKLH